MQTDIAPVLPVPLPAPKVRSQGAAPSLTGAQDTSRNPKDVEETGSDTKAPGANDADKAGQLSVFDQALAQMAMVQNPVAIPLPTPHTQLGLSTNPVDIAAAIASSSEAVPQGDILAGTDLGLGAKLASPVIDPDLAGQTMVMGQPANDATNPFVMATPSVQAQVGETAEAQSVMVHVDELPDALASKDVEFTVLTPIAHETSAPKVQSAPAPIQAPTLTPTPTNDANLMAKTSLVQAMGTAASDPTASIVGTVPAQSAAAVATINEPTAQSLMAAKFISPEMAQAASKPSSTPITPPSSAPTSTIMTSLAVVAATTSGAASGQDLGGNLDDAPSEFSGSDLGSPTAQASEATLESFNTPLPVEGRVLQANLPQGSLGALSTPATAPHLAAEISRKFEGKSAQFDITLTPEGLGKVDVKITINARGEVSAAMKFDNPQAAAELKSRASELQNALEQSGFNLSRDGISFNDGQGQGFGTQQQAGRQDWQETARRAAQNRLFQDNSDLADATALRVAEASSAYSRRSSTGVDVRI